MTGMNDSIATILSALTIIWAGKLIDTVSLKKYTLAIVLGLSITCFFASIVFNGDGATGAPRC